MADKKDKKVLVVEDDETLAGMYIERFSQEGYSVLHAIDGQTGVELIEQHMPDFIILDIMLPKKNGFEVLEIIKNTPGAREIPVIVLSAFPRAEYIEKVTSFGAIGFFNKAVTVPGEIAQLVNKMLYPGE